ncbi:MAG TPA: ABC transporter ATP-binding protein [Polyangiaceae bacterium]|nr:ABC transporter ATP-binding protein [Polyangiaceae bacterium]
MTVLRPEEPAPWLGTARATLRYLLRTLQLVVASSRALVAGFAALTLVSATTPVLIAYAGKHIVDSVLLAHHTPVLNWVLIEFALVVLLSLAQRGLGLLRSLLGARLGTDINVRILSEALELELAFFENAEFYDKLTRARREASSRPVALISDAFQLLQSLVTLAGYSALLTAFSGWVVPVLILATLPATVAEMRYSKLGFRLRNWRSPDSRRLLYLEYVLANDEHAKEVRLLGIGPHLLQRYRTLSETFLEQDRALALRRAGATQALSLLGTLAFYGTYALMAIAAASGRISLGNMTLYVVSLRQGQAAFQSVLSSIGNLYEHNLYMANLFDYFGLAQNHRESALEAGSERPALPNARSGIVFENVSFRYPGKSAFALSNLTLEIRPGESVALVGDNGAGKTTFVKLLTRLYEPTEGHIFLDGQLLSEIPRDALRRRFGVVFQDFNQYQLHLRENVGFGSIEHLPDEPRIGRAIERGGANELLTLLPGGLDAPLGHWFEKGSELSGGQWQKVALARAFMREEADILILDEPTAALDAHAEHAVFERFRELSQGRTTIVISHRFPAVRMAQRILVLEAGKIIEQGSHDELVRARGKYFRMFSLQAEGYQ